jgi:hypothetical protein
MGRLVSQPGPTGGRYRRNVSPILNSDDVVQLNLLRRVCHRIQRCADPRQYQLFDLVAFRGWSITKTAGILYISRIRVYLAQHRIAKLMKKEIARLADEAIYSPKL